MQTVQQGARRPVAFFGVAVFLGAWLSYGLGFRTPNVMLLWLPTSIVLVGLLTRGPTVLLPAAIGVAAWAHMVGAAAPEVAALVGGTLIAPFVTWRVIGYLRGRKRATSHLVQTVQLLLSISLIQAPIAAALGSFMMCPQIGFDHSKLAIFLSYWVVEAASGVVLVRALMSWMPEDGSGFCPVAGINSGVRSISRADIGSILALFGAAGLCGAAILLDQVTYARLLLVPVFGVAMVSSLLTGRRMSSLVLLLSAMMVIGLRVNMEPFATERGFLTEIAQVELVMLIGSSLLHLLNALTEERLVQQRRLERQVRTNETSGLPNLRALRATLRRCARDPACAGLRLAEISIGDMASRADLVGRTSLVTFEREAGRRLVQIFGRSLKTLSHIGTGRFVAVLDPDLDEMKIQSLVRTKFEGHRFVMGERHVNVRCTVGVVDVSRRSARDPDAVLAALSIAQQVAGNRADRFHLLDKSGAELNAYREQLDWIERVRAMLREGRLKIMAQPIAPSSVSAYNGLHYEILSRLVAPDGTVLAPNRFLTAISQARLLEEFDRQVITTVLSRLAEDRSLYDATRVCAINVTGPTLCDPALPQFLDLNLRRYGIDPTRIAIEITESESMTNLDQALENVAKIRDSGVLIAVDDFGTGLATFDYIRRFTPQILKIDGSFVRSLDGSALDAEIVQSIVRIGAAIGARTVAECVETPEMAIRLCELGVDYVQGWAIARPMPLEALKGFCDRRRAEIASGDGLMVAGPCMPGTNESDLTDCALAAAS